MADNSKIEWTDATWNPIRARRRDNGKVGFHCEHVSPACEHCYAEAMNKRGLFTGLPYKPGHRKDVEIFLDEKTLLQPLRWKKPRKIFVCSMTDLFADFVPDEMIDKVFAVMALAPQHIFQILTKRPARMRKIVSRMVGLAQAAKFGGTVIADEFPEITTSIAHPQGLIDWPLRNVWIGVTVEDQPRADERREDLKATPAAVHFVSYEPALGPVDWTGWEFVKQIIFGGESGPKARPAHPQWARYTRDFCAANGIAYFHKQWGEFIPIGQHLPGCGKIHGATAVKPGRMKLHYGGTPQRYPDYAFAEKGVWFVSTDDGRLIFRVGKARAGRLLDGVEHNGFPEARNG